MQLCDSGRERQAEAGSRTGAAALEPHEALEDTAPLLRGDALAAIGHGDEDALALAARTDGDVRPVGHGATFAMFDGVVHQVRDGLADELAIAADDDRGR